MSNKRQTALLYKKADAGAEVTTLVYDYLPNYYVREHFHDTAQLVYATKGVMTITVARETWTVPPQKAVWIPADVQHSIQMSKAVSMHTLYIAPKLARKLAKTCQVLFITPLLRELILYCCTLKKLSMKDAACEPLIKVILRQIHEAQAMPLQLPYPSDRRAMKIATLLLADPSDQRTLNELCVGTGASKKTMERLFQAETNMNFGKWRQQLRLLHAIKLVAEGSKITQAALDSGYNSPSAFISMFRKTLGTTPSRYFQ